LISQGVPLLGESNWEWGGIGKAIYFRAKYVNISKTVGDT